MPEARKDSRGDFSLWLRTGQRYRSRAVADEVEYKFNPWHDPANGRFTFAGTGQHHGTRGLNEASAPRGHRSGLGQVPQSSIARKDRSRVVRTPDGGKTIGVPGSRGSAPPNALTEFVGGVGEGLYGAVEGTAQSVRDVLTTNPITTVRNTGRAIAGAIDSAIAAEDTPALVQASRAVNAIRNASARDIGRATGSIAGNVALGVVPEAGFSKLAAARRLRLAKSRPTYLPPQIGWAKETHNSNRPWVAYNDAASGARPGLAPTLMRTMPDGSQRPVKFDGVQGDYVIDRKWIVMDAPRARAQILRQSEVLAQHRLIATWEVPNALQKTKALNLLKKMNVTNINVRVVKP